MQQKIIHASNTNHESDLRTETETETERRQKSPKFLGQIQANSPICLRLRWCVASGVREMTISTQKAHNPNPNPNPNPDQNVCIYIP